MEALLLVGMVVLICLAFIIESTVHQLKQTMEKRMTELADAVAALTAGVNAHGAAQAKALASIQADFDAAVGGGADAAQAAERVRASVALLAQSTSTLETLDLDPSNPVVPPPPPVPDDTGTTPTTPPGGGTAPPPAPGTPPPAPGPGGEVPAPAPGDPTAPTPPPTA